MKKILFALFILSKVTFAQDTSTKINSDSTAVAFEVIEKVPIYKGCDITLSNRDLRQCMSTSIAKHVSKHFKTNIAKKLDLPNGKVRINVFFKINAKGKVIDIKASTPHFKLEKEAIRVIKMIPKLKKPGYHKGKAVSVPYSLPIIFNVE